MIFGRPATWLLLCSWILLSCGERQAPELRLAVAANFRPALELLRAEFERDCTCRLDIVSGSTGLLYSQIREGAPFDVFLAADSLRPGLLERDRLTLAGSRKTYARGQLALWLNRNLASETGKRTPGFTPGAGFDVAGAQMEAQQLAQLLRRWRDKIVIADPQLAPYGDAAVQLLRKLKLWRRLRGQMVYAANVGHAQILLQEGHANLGLIPLSLALAGGPRGEHIAIPVDYYPPLEQQLVILKSSSQQPLAARFVQFVLSAETQQRLGALGYFPISATGSRPEEGDGFHPREADGSRSIEAEGSPMEAEGSSSGEADGPESR